MSQDRSRKTSVEAVIQVRDDPGRDHSGRTLDIFKEETTGFSNELDSGCERKSKVKNDCKV